MAYNAAGITNIIDPSFPAFFMKDSSAFTG
jgi:hypothetical protein